MARLSKSEQAQILNEIAQAQVFENLNSGSFHVGYVHGLTKAAEYVGMSTLVVMLAREMADHFSASLCPGRSIRQCQAGCTCWEKGLPPITDPATDGILQNMEALQLKIAGAQDPCNGCDSADDCNASLPAECERLNDALAKPAGGLPEVVYHAEWCPADSDPDARCTCQECKSTADCDQVDDSNCPGCPFV